MEKYSPFLRPLGADALQRSSERKKISSTAETAAQSAAPVMRPPVLAPLPSRSSEKGSQRNTAAVEPGPAVLFSEKPVSVSAQESPPIAASPDIPADLAGLGALFDLQPETIPETPEGPDAVDSSLLPQPCTVAVLAPLFSEGKRRGRPRTKE